MLLSTVYDMFLKWVQDKRIPSGNKTMLRMIKKYREFHAMLRTEVEADGLLKESIRQRISGFLESINFYMRVPKIVESKRCVSY